MSRPTCFPWAARSFRKNRCALRSHPPGLGRSGRPFPPPILAALVLGFLLSPPPAPGAQNILVSITLNKEKKGEIFVLRTETGDFLVRAVDLEAMGVEVAPAYVSEVEGERVVSLRSIPNVSFIFHEKTIALEIFVPPP